MSWLDFPARQTQSLKNEMNFSHVHVFSYSPRRGTKAYEYTDQNDNKIKDKRNKAMRELAARMKKDFNRRFIGQEMDVLFENNKGDDLYEGLTDNYIRVLTKGNESIRNAILSVKLKELKGLYVLGEII